ncbi:MAG: DNA polymerase III subunit gamma/tau [Candidatus Omnitrophota bacterium]
MSYIVLARKWRPQELDEVIGQDHITKTLKNAILNNRLAHAYLFSGPRGVGKTSTARIFAKSLNCEKGPTVKPCQKCVACREITESRSLDVIEIDGASNTGIDNVRQLRENVKFSPVNGRFKIYIIDEVHMLSDAAFNALLKTLEEPPAHVKFVFATTQPHKIISTIISRCQRFDFRRVPALKITEKLEKITASEKLNVDKRVLFAIARASDGSIRDAESILDQLVSFSKEKLQVSDVVSLLGILEQESLFELTEYIIKKDSLGALKLLDRLINEGKDTAQFIPHLLEHFRNILVAKIGKDSLKGLIDLTAENQETIYKQSQFFSISELLNIMNLIISTGETTKRLETLRIPLEVLLVKLTHSGPSALKEKQENNPHTLSSIKMPQQPKARNNPVNPTSIPKIMEPKINAAKLVEPLEEPHSPNEPKAEEANTHITDIAQIKNVWPDLINELGKVKMSTATYLQEGAPLKIEKSLLTVGFAKSASLHREVLEKNDNKSLIENTLNNLLNTKLRINFTTTEIGKTGSTERKEDESFIKSALETFRGRVFRRE